MADKGHRAVTLSNVKYPEGIDDAEFRGLLAEEVIIVAGGLAAYAGKLSRLGHMGNIDMHDLVSVIATIERALYRSVKLTELGKCVGILMKELLPLCTVMVSDSCLKKGGQNTSE